MREILFRGKHIHLFPQNENLNGTWVYGYLCDRNYINSPGLNGELRVDPSTVGQYTGMKDKNGERIFEGDVIKRLWLGAEIIYCVRYDGEDAHFIGKAMNKSGFTTFDNDGEMFEVIGNIHDNPELLEEA